MRSQASIWSRAAAVLALVALHGLAHAAEQAVLIPAPAFDEQLADASSSATAVLAGGCFWGVQGVFQHVEGVLKAVSGYAGGSAANAKYELVGNGDTGHAETVRIVYDPSKITYGRLLQIFFSVVHDPTQLNKQGPDHGPPYRSAIFVENAQQRAIAERYIAQLEAAKVYRAKIVTTLEEAPFYPAEAYHQDFLERNPTHPYIAYNDLPKVRDLRSVFPNVYRAEPALVLARARAR
ncbi:MAG TPA: peptide-methionine (S)-S-oxide reductase MsrA [Gammaproteobacteria bacterium]|nr:peptide-methionine (S)-S-oxide reductase MsrA [Gammaproteobacteria bacterium]